MTSGLRALLYSMKLYDAYLFDLDGTVYLGGERLLPTARETILRLLALGRKVLYLTNEASQTPENFVVRLARLGLPARPEEIINSSSALIELLRERLPGAHLFVIGESSLYDELEAAGFTLTDDPSQVQAVIASNDHDFHFRKLKIAFDAIQAGAAFYATNADRTIPLPSGGLEPDAAAIIAAVEACTGRPLDLLAGKPSPFMAETALRRLGLPPEACLLVGDNLDTDILMGKRAKLDTALVLTGISQESALSRATFHPTYVIRQLTELIDEGS